MEKVFVLLTEVIVDGAYERGVFVQTFKTQKGAERELKKFADKERKLCNEDGWEITCDHEKCFEAQMKGEFAYNHSCAHVVECNVID